MIDQSAATELLHAYLQTDAPVRAQQFPAFVQALQALAAEQGWDAVAPWARRAVSPLLDYSSLLKLRRLLRLEQ